MLKKFLYIPLSFVEPFVTIFGYSISVFLCASGILLFFAKLINAFNINSYLDFVWVFLIVSSGVLIFCCIHWYTTLVEKLSDSHSQPDFYPNLMKPESIKYNSKAAVVALHNQVSLARAINQRNNNFIGRAINFLSMETPNPNIEISSEHLTSILELLNETPDNNHKPDTSYLLPFHKAEHILKKLSHL